MHSLTGRSLLTLLDLSSEEILHILDLADAAREDTAAGRRPRRFEGRTLAMIFEKRSTRTRAAFETAFGEEGGHPVFLSTADIQLGAKETVADTARVLGSMFDIVQYRGFSQATAEELAAHAGIPVINGLTDTYHPTQALADAMTIREHTGTLEGSHTTYIGDGRNNVSNSLLIVAAALGLHHEVICPPELTPDVALMQRLEPIASKSGARLTVRHSASEIDATTAAIYTDVWTSMGEEAREAERIALLAPYRVTDEVMARAPEAIFLHCLPAVRGNEVTESVIDGPRSRVWQQAANRKHTIKAVMLALLGLA